MTWSLLSPGGMREVGIISEEAREHVILRSAATKNLRCFPSTPSRLNRTRSIAKSAVGEGRSEEKEGSQAHTLDSSLRSE